MKAVATESVKVRLPKADLRKLAEHSKGQDRTMAAEIRRAIRQYLATIEREAA